MSGASPLSAVITVTTTSVSDASDISGLNCAGLVDATGKELLPQQYAAIDVLNDRFAHVSQVTHAVESKDDALVYYSNEPFSFMPDEDDTFFGGTWSIVDLTTVKPVPGATGTKPYTRSAKGNFVTLLGLLNKTRRKIAQRRLNLFSSMTVVPFFGAERTFIPSVKLSIIVKPIPLLSPPSSVV